MGQREKREKQEMKKQIEVEGERNIAEIQHSDNQSGTIKHLARPIQWFCSYHFTIIENENKMERGNGNFHLFFAFFFQKMTRRIINK